LTPARLNNQPPKIKPPKSGPEVYEDEARWRQYMNDRDELVLACHIYSCT
jgi:hypothetical protein